MTKAEIVFNKLANIDGNKGTYISDTKGNREINIKALNGACITHPLAELAHPHPLVKHPNKQLPTNILTKLVQ